METYFTPVRYLRDLLRRLMLHKKNADLSSSVKDRTCEARIETDENGVSRIVFLRDTTGEQN